MEPKTRQATKEVTKLLNRLFNVLFLGISGGSEASDTVIGGPGCWEGLLAPAHGTFRYQYLSVGWRVPLRLPSIQEV